MDLGPIGDLTFGIKQSGLQGNKAAFFLQQSYLAQQNPVNTFITSGRLGQAVIIHILSGIICGVPGCEHFPTLDIGMKAGVIMATKVMAVEWAQYNIRVNAIAPGNVHTRLGDSRFVAVPEYEEELVVRTPIRRIAEPEEMVGAMIYLASDASSFVTGETVVVDGGQLLT